MGYYSDVTLALTKEGIDALNAKLADNTLSEKTIEETRYLFEHADRHLVDKDSGSEIWYWESIKWYEGDPEYFPDVDFIESLMAELDSDDYRFMRVGEDNDDTEIRGDYWDDPFDLALCRSISLAEAV